MRTPPLLADFTHARPCKPFCENSLTLPLVQRDKTNLANHNKLHLFQRAQVVVQGPFVVLLPVPQGRHPDDGFLHGSSPLIGKSKETLENRGPLCTLEGTVKIDILKSRKGIEGPLNRPSGRRRFCAVRAFCRRQNLGAGGIHFRRAFQIPPVTIKITTPDRCGYFYGRDG